MSVSISHLNNSQPNGAPLPYNADTGFNVDDGAFLLMAFCGLQAETTEHGQLHETVSNELRTLVIDPFRTWTEKYRVHFGIPLGCSCILSWIQDETRTSKRTGVGGLDR